MKDFKTEKSKAAKRAIIDLLDQMGKPSVYTLDDGSVKITTHYRSVNEIEKSISILEGLIDEPTSVTDNAFKEALKDHPEVSGK